MSAPILAGAASGILVASGVLVAVPLILADHRSALSGGMRWSRRPILRRRAAPRILGAASAAVLVGAITRWPAAAVLAAGGVWWLPGLLGGDRDTAQALARTEAVAGWAESLRDTLTAAHGLRQTIAATAPSAPAAIRPQLDALSGRLRRGMSIGDALRHFAAEVADPVADLVAAALTHAADNQARHLAALLGALAATARDRAAARLRIAATRTKALTTVRIIAATTGATAAALVAFNRPFLAPYGSPFGQLVLLVVGVLFGLGLWWIRRLGSIPDEPRILAPPSAKTDSSSADPVGAQPW